jgi:hypothetical protein
MTRNGEVHVSILMSHLSRPSMNADGHFCWRSVLKLRTEFNVLRMLSVRYKPYMHECISFLPLWSSFFYSFLFYCFLHFLVTHTWGSESKSLHSDWTASRKFSRSCSHFLQTFRWCFKYTTAASYHVLSVHMQHICAIWGNVDLNHALSLILWWRQDIPLKYS